MPVFIYLFFVSLLFGQLPSLFGFHVYAHDVMLGALIIWWFISGKFRRSVTGSDPVKPMLVFVGAALIAILMNIGNLTQPEIMRSLFYLTRWIFYASLFFIVRSSHYSKDFWFKRLFWVGVSFAIIGLLQFFLYPDFRNLQYLGWDPYYWRLVGTLFDPNFVGIILVLTVLLRSKYAWSLLPAILLTFSRSSFLGLIVGLVIQKRWKILWGFLMLLGVTAIIPKPQLEAFNLTREVSTFARVNNWQQSFDVFLQSPIIGHGFPARLENGAGIDNSFLFVLASSGIVGFSAFVWLWWNIVKSARGVLLASVVAVFISSLFVNSLFYPWVMIWLWILIGVSEKSSE